MVGGGAGAPVHHSHVETVGPRAWAGTGRVLSLEEDAVREGVDLSGDVIPYTAVCTTLLALYPPWALEGGIGQFLDRLRDPDLRRRMKDEVASARAVWPPWVDPGRFTMNIALECGWESIRLAHVEAGPNKRHEDRTIAEIGRGSGKHPFDALSDLMLEEGGVATQLIFGISGDEEHDEHLVPLLQCPRLSFVTDAWDIGKGRPHPGAWGAFPRVLGHYVRERGLLPLEAAIARMSGLPASRLGLRDRGRVEQGMMADIVVFDPGTVAARSTYREPSRAAAGIDEVLINGVRVVANGTFRPSAAGRVLRKGGS